MPIDYNFNFPLQSDSFLLKEEPSAQFLAQFRCLFISPSAKFFDDEILSVLAPSPEGAISIWSHHAPLVTALTKGIVRLTVKGGFRFFSIDSGVLEVDAAKNQVLILASRASEVKGLEEINQSLTGAVKK